jgi:hypothetical protein
MSLQGSSCGSRVAREAVSEQSGEGGIEIAFSGEGSIVIACEGGIGGC